MASPLETRRTADSACANLEITVRFLEKTYWLSEMLGYGVDGIENFCKKQ